MIIKRDGYMQDKITRACYRFAQYMRLEIKEKEDKFTLKEAIKNEEQYWFDKKTMDKEAFSEFLLMCSSYSSSNSRIPTAIYVYKIECSS